MSLTMKTNTLQALLTGTVVGGRGYGISHSWDGSVLTVRSDSGSSSADLLGPAGSDAEKLIVNVSGDGDSGYRADMCFAEIEAAISEGVLPVVRLVGANGVSYGQLVHYGAGRMLQFGAWLHGGIVDASAVITMDAEDSVSLSYPAAPKAVAVTAKKEGTTVTVTVSYEDLSSENTVIALDDNGDPVSVAKNGAVCSLTWEGFDE